MTAPHNFPTFPPFVLVHPGHPGIIFDLAHTDEQAVTKLYRLNSSGDTGFRIEPNAARHTEPGPLEKIIAELVQKFGSEVEAHTAIYELIHKPLPFASETAQPTAEPVIQPEPPVLPPECPFHVGEILRDSFSDTLGQVREIIPAEPSGTRGLKLALHGHSRLHFVPAANYGDFGPAFDKDEDALDEMKAPGYFGHDPVSLPPAAGASVVAKSPDQIAATEAKEKARMARKPPPQKSPPRAPRVKK